MMFSSKPTKRKENSMNIGAIARKFVEKKALIDMLQKEVDNLKLQIIQYHAGRDVIREAGIESKLTPCLRTTLQKDAVERLLGKPIPETCFKRTSYDSLKVKIING